jgi:hypothetical protein
MQNWNVSWGKRNGGPFEDNKGVRTGSGLFVVNHWTLGERCKTKSPDPVLTPSFVRRCAAPEIETDRSYGVLTSRGCPPGLRGTTDSTARETRVRRPANSVTKSSELCTVATRTGNGRD